MVTILSSQPRSNDRAMVLSSQARSYVNSSSAGSGSRISVVSSASIHSYGDPGREGHVSGFPPSNYYTSGASKQHLWSFRDSRDCNSEYSSMHSASGSSSRSRGRPISGSDRYRRRFSDDESLSPSDSITNVSTQYSSDGYRPSPRQNTRYDLDDGYSKRDRQSSFGDGSSQYAVRVIRPRRG